MFSKVGESSQRESRRELPQRPPPFGIIIIIANPMRLGGRVKKRKKVPNQLAGRGRGGVLSGKSPPRRERKEGGGECESGEQPYEPIKELLSQE